MRHAIAVISSVAFLTACNVEERSVAPVIEYGSIDGVVNLNDGGVAAGIDVRLSRIENNCMLCGWGTTRIHEVDHTQADQGGAFDFPKVRSGRYQISLGPYEGYSAGDLDDFTVWPDQATSVTYVLVATQQVQ